MKRCFIDVETTGLSPERNGIWQIAGIVEIDGKVEDKFTFTFRPHHAAAWDTSARFMVPPDVLDRLESGTVMTSSEAYTELQHRLHHVDRYDKSDKYFFLAYNAYFDWNFLQAFFLQHGDKYFGSLFAYPPIDIAVLAAECLQDERLTLQNFKLPTVAKHFGIEIQEDRLHEAGYDVELAHGLYHAIRFKGAGRIPETVCR